jgi:outer membrane protein assembly factor BamD
MKTMSYLSISPIIPPVSGGRRSRPHTSLRALISGLLVAAMLAGCAGQNEDDALVRDVTRAYEKAQSSMENGNYRSAIQIFEMLRARFPFSDISKQIQLELMYAYYMSDQQEQAIDMAEQFLRENPTHPRVDYALYIQGLAYFEKEPGFLVRRFKKNTEGRPPQDADLAFSIFSRLVQRYPASEYAEDARQRMVYLKNRLAAYENAVARYYIKIGAFVAALNRAKGSLEQYNGAAANRDSLLIMIEAYEGLGMHELAEDTRRVLEKNTQMSAN